MKKLALLLIIASILYGCSKENFMSAKFKGIWEYENHFGYPFNNNYLPPGNGNIIALSADGSYERRKHDTVIFKGQFQLKTQRDCYGSERKVHFTTNDTTFNWDSYVEIDNSGKLVFTSPNCYADGGSTYYIKIADN